MKTSSIFRSGSQPLTGVRPIFARCRDSNANGVVENCPRLPVCGLPGVLAAPAPTPKEVVASKDCALCVEDTLTALSTCPRHNLLRGWERRAFSQGSLRGQPLAPFLSHHQHLSRKARWASLQNTVGVPDQKTCRRNDQTPNPGWKQAPQCATLHPP